jgi:hypothetical protein
MNFGDRKGIHSSSIHVLLPRPTGHHTPHVRARLSASISVVGESIGWCCFMDGVARMLGCRDRI